MKRFLNLFLAIGLGVGLFSLVGCSCYDEQFEDLNNRLNKIENDLTALQGRKVVENVTFKEGKAILHFTDGTTQELPSDDLIKLGVDGDYNWTINGKSTGISARGLKGDKGDKGDQGEKGDKGDQGEKGDKGDQGEKGDKGDQGEKGDKGDQGEKGDKGDQGDRGVKGDCPFINADGNWAVVITNEDGTTTVKVLTDENNKPIKAQGPKGDNAPVPFINEDGNWALRHDDGTTEEILVDGKPVRAKAPVVTIGEDGYWYIDGEKTEFVAFPGKGGSVVIYDNDDTSGQGFVTIQVFGKKGEKLNNYTFLRESARLTSVTIVPEASYEGWPAIKWTYGRQWLFDMNSTTKITDADPGVDTKVWNKKFLYTKEVADDEEPNTMTVRLRLNPSTFDPSNIEKVEINFKEVEVLRSMVEASEGKLPEIIAPKDNDWSKSIDKDGYLVVKLSEYIAKDAVSKRTNGRPENLQLANFLITNKQKVTEVDANGVNVAVASNYASIWSEQGGLKQPYVFYTGNELDPTTGSTAEPLFENYKDVNEQVLAEFSNEEASVNPMGFRNIALSEPTNLNELVNARLNTRMKELMKREDYNISFSYELAPLYDPNGALPANSSRYLKVSEEGILTPSFEGRDAAGECVNKTENVLVTMSMGDKQVNLGYIPVTIREDREELDPMIFRYDETFWYNPTASAGGIDPTTYPYTEATQVPKFSIVDGKLVGVDGKEDFFTNPDWFYENLVAYVNKNRASGSVEMTDENARILYDEAFIDANVFADVADKMGNTDYTGVDNDVVNPGFPVTDAQNSTYNMFAFLGVDGCKEVGKYYISVRFNLGEKVDQAGTPLYQYTNKDYPESLTIIFPFEIVDPNAAKIEAAKTQEQFRLQYLPNVWTDDLTIAKNIPVADQGFQPVLSTLNVIKKDGMKTFIESMIELVKDGEPFQDPKFFVAFKDKEDAKLYEFVDNTTKQSIDESTNTVTEFELTAANNYDFNLTRRNTQPLADPDDVELVIYVKEGLDPNTCDATKELKYDLAECTVKFVHPVKWSFLDEVIFPADANIVVYGEDIIIRDDVDTHTFSLKDIFKITFPEKNDEALFENGALTALENQYHILGPSPVVVINEPTDDLYTMYKGAGAFNYTPDTDPSNFNASFTWSNNQGGASRVIDAFTMEFKFDFRYGNVTTNATPLPPYIMKDRTFTIHIVPSVNKNGQFDGSIFENYVKNFK